MKAELVFRVHVFAVAIATLVLFCTYPFMTICPVLKKEVISNLCNRSKRCNSVTMPKCEKCGALIDRGACGNTFAIITIKDDRANNPDSYHQLRKYLCNDCVPELTLFLLNEKVN